MKLKTDISELLLRINKKEILLLKDISFSTEENKIYSVIGRNGSGKTTLIQTFSHLLDKRFYIVKGEVFADGKPLSVMNEDELLEYRRSKIKYVFQDALNSFDPLRTLSYYFKNFEIPLSEADELLSYFQLPELSKINTMYPWQLSGGMIQRFSLVLSMLMNPEMLVLDEPTSGIDAPAANLMMLKLKEFAHQPKKSVFIITQDMAFASAVSNKIAHINNKTLSPFLDADDYMKSSDRIFAE